MGLQAGDPARLVIPRLSRSEVRQFWRELEPHFLELIEAKAVPEKVWPWLLTVLGVAEEAGLITLD